VLSPVTFPGKKNVQIGGFAVSVVFLLKTRMNPSPRCCLRSQLLLAAASLLLCLLPGQVHSQADTLYLQNYYNNLIPRVLTSFKSQSTQFVTSRDSSYAADHFSTGAQFFAGAELSYKWASIGYNYGFNPANSSSNTDLRFSTSYKPLRFQANYTSLRNLNYFRVNGPEQEDTVRFVQHHTIPLRNAGLKIDYIFNYKKCYYSSSVGQYGRQLRSRGTFLLSSGISWQDFDLKSLPDSAAQEFVKQYDADHFRTVRLDVGPGYGYNWVIKRNWVICISEIPNLGFQWVSTSTDNRRQQRMTVSFTNYVRSGVTYSWKNMFAGAYLYNSVTVSGWDGFNYNNVYTTCQLHFGVVLGDPEEYLRRKWKG
jgi:hypothetical protein